MFLSAAFGGAVDAYLLYSGPLYVVWYSLLITGSALSNAVELPQIDIELTAATDVTVHHVVNTCSHWPKLMYPYSKRLNDAHCAVPD